jgi:hypothetical protein
METYAKFPYLIEVTHPAFATFRFANSDEDIIYEGQKYESAYFTIDPPDRDGSKIGDGQLTISAIDQLWIERIRTIQTAAKIKFLATIAYDDGVVSGVEPIEEMEFTLRIANWNENTITWAMVFDENMAIRVPCDRATALKCPGAA